MKELLEVATRGTKAAFESPVIAAALYAVAVAAVLVTVGFREED